MKVLIVDIKDSFTYNLEHYVKHFCANVNVVRYNKLLLSDVETYDKVLLSPGPGLPKDYPILRDILISFGSSKSILGICLGHQAIAEFYGCSLDNLDSPMHGISTQINHLNNCILFKDVPVSFQIGHYHSWIVSEKAFPEALEVTSINEDGLIMSLKHKRYNIKSLQFHPESVLTDYGLELIENWLSD